MYFSTQLPAYIVQNCICFVFMYITKNPDQPLQVNSQVDPCAGRALTADAVASLSRDFEACEFTWEKESIILKAKSIDVRYLDMRSRKPNAGTVLQHCKAKALQFRKVMGLQVCVFKIGYTSNPIFRFRKYELLNYSRMALLHVTSCKGAAEMLEAALIDQHIGLSGCRNEQLGGEGPGHIQAPDYYVYIVGARADQAKPIG